jgi:hypothetical protein
MVVNGPYSLTWGMIRGRQECTLTSRTERSLEILLYNSYIQAHCQPQDACEAAMTAQVILPHIVLTNPAVTV